jgi:hypothetical protein
VLPPLPDDIFYPFQYASPAAASSASAALLLLAAVALSLLL